MNIAKIQWMIRYLVYSLVSDFRMPGYLGKPTYISDARKIYIDKNSRIYPGMRAEIIGDDARVEIGKNTSIGQNFHIVSHNRKLSIGSNVTISGNVFISNCDHAYNEIDVHILEQEIIEKDTTISDNCFIGYGAVILAGSILGKQCIVGANSVVRGSFPDYCVICGNPAKIIRKYNVESGVWEKV